MESQPDSQHHTCHIFSTVTGGLRHGLLVTSTYDRDEAHEPSGGGDGRQSASPAVVPLMSATGTAPCLPARLPLSGRGKHGHLHL